MLIDFSKLSRDFSKVPIGIREPLLYEDVYYLYWELNLTKKQTGKILGCSDRRIYNFAKEHGLIKSQKMITESQKNLMFERYGVDNYMKTSVGKSKCKIAIQDVFEKHGADIVKKREETYFSKTGFKNPSQNPNVKKKKEYTSLKNNGTKNPQQNREINARTNATFKERYGANPLSKDSDIYNRTVQGILDKYNVDNVMKCEEVAKKTSETLKKNQSIYIQQNLEKYGVEYPTKLQEVIDKINLTKSKRGTYNTSTEELAIKEMLEKLFVVIYNKTHKPRYPFRCDFYIPEIDLFIEYNGTWTHGFRPYNPNDIECQKDVELLQRKAETSKYYKNALYNWTVRDVKKRETAKQNNLNWIEFFNMNEFMMWYNKL